jgi:hypothetical protein
MMTAYSLFWWSASQQNIVFGLHWNIWWLPIFCFGGQRHNKRSYLVFTETYDDCLQSVLMVSVSTKDRVLSSLKHMMTAYSLFWWSAIVFCLHWNIWWLPTVCFWWSASQQKIVFCLHWNIWRLPTVCFGGQRHHKRSYFVFTETYDDCLQSVLVVCVSTKDRVLSSLKHMMTAYSLFWWSASQQRSYLVSLKHMMTAYSLFWWSASQQKIVFCLHWNIWWLPTVCFGGQRLNKRSYLDHQNRL